jgi:ribosomal protein S4
MRRHKKYKIFLRTAELKTVPIRVLSFKRPKWSRLKRNISMVMLKAFTLCDVSKTIVKRRAWGRTRFYHQQVRQNVRFIRERYDGSFTFKRSLSKIKGSFDRSQNTFQVLLHPFYSLDTFLVLMNIASSVYSARQLISRKLITVNDRFVGANKTLQKGDIVDFSLFKGFRYDKKLIVQDFTISTFVECDFYNQKVVVIKDCKELTSDDACLLCTKGFRSRDLFF